MITGTWDGKYVKIVCTMMVCDNQVRLWSMEQLADSPKQAEFMAMNYLAKRGDIETIQWEVK